MKVLPQAALDALASGDVVVSASAAFHFGTVHRVWSGIGALAIEGDAYTGIGARGLLIPIAEDIGGAASGLRLRLSGLETAVAMTIEAEDYHQRPVVLRRLIFGPDRRTLLAWPAFFRGRVDLVRIEEEVGGEAVLEIAVESGARDLDRFGSRVRSDADQRVLGGPTDGGMKHVAAAGERTLYWGALPPARARSAAPVGGGAGGGSGFGGAGGDFTSGARVF